MTTILKDNNNTNSTSVQNNNVLSGNNVMPMKGQTSLNNNHFSMMRSIFQSAPKNHPENNTLVRGKNALYQDHSLYLQKKKSRAVGKQMYSSPLSFNSNLKQDVKQAQRRMRSSGAVPPPKSSVV